MDECPVDCIYEGPRMLYDVSALGSPGGAAQVGRASVDHPKVASFEI